MITIRFKLPDGEVREIEGREGESVMSTAVSHDVPGIVGECGGELSCATCHVYERAGEFTPMSADEDDLLELVDDREDASRLGCQLRLREGMADIDLEVPPSSLA